MVVSEEARTINGKSHKVRTIRGELRESARKRGDIGVPLVIKGMATRVSKKAVFRERGVLYA